jgi:hypothetical protein
MTAMTAKAEMIVFIRRTPKYELRRIIEAGHLLHLRSIIQQMRPDNLQFKA